MNKNDLISNITPSFLNRQIDRRYFDRWTDRQLKEKDIKFDNTLLL